MHKEPYKAFQNPHRHKTSNPLDSHHLDQHGCLPPQAFSVLLALPSESLTHVTSFLDPHSLLALNQVNKHLHNHIKDDNAWHRAFVFQFLGVDPEGDVGGLEGLMLRRTENTWRKEYIIRWNLRMRWERSRSTTVTHSPHHSYIASIHLMSENALLATSLFYGVASRSVPLTGKVVKGFLDAAGSQQGLGIGNPNAEFAPNVSACALTSEGATAYVLWGYRSGEVAITIAPRAMDTAIRSAATLVRCAVHDQHDTIVSDVAWADNKSICVSSDVRGVVKIWDTKTMRCLWTSPHNQTDPVPVGPVKVALNSTLGVLVAGHSNGAVIMWHGFGDFSQEIASSSIHEFKVVIPKLSTRPFEVTNKSVASVVIDPTSITQPVILVTNEQDPFVHRYGVTHSSRTVVHTRFGNEAFGPVRSVLPCFASQTSEQSFILVGDQLGGVSVYNWQVPASSVKKPLPPLRRIEAHGDGPVTALVANASVLVTGSERGTTKVWDSLTLTALKTHAAPGLPRNSVSYASVKQIVLTKDMMVAAIGQNVLAWKAGPVDNRTGKAIMKSLKKPHERHQPAKGHIQREIKIAIKESSRVMEHEQAQTRAIYGREREHHTALEGLGLSEVEAVEYMLMLSRDDEEQRRLRDAMDSSLRVDDEGVFEADFDDDADFRTPMVEQRDAFQALNVPSSPTESSISHPSPPPTSHSPSMASLLSEHSRAYTSRSLPQSVPRMSWGRLQVSPRARPEPMEAGFSSPSPESLSPPVPPATEDEEHFPPMSHTPSSVGTSIPSTPASVQSIRRSMSGSPDWARVARGMAPSTPGTAGGGYHNTAARAPQVGQGSPAQRRNHRTSAPVLTQTRSEPLSSLGPSLLSSSLALQGGRNALPAQDEDEELRFAIELSLAEARSRGEDV